MESVESIEAQAHLSRLLKRAAMGEEFTITQEGKPVARLIPPQASMPATDVRAAVEAMKVFRKGRTLGGLSIRDMIEEGRRV